MKTSVTCKKAIDLISKKEEGKITLWQRFQLWKHFAECSLCKLFNIQNKTIVDALPYIQHDISEPLSAEEKKEIVDNSIHTK